MSDKQLLESQPTLTKLFLLFFKISGFTLGGGAVMLPLMDDEFVKKRAWLTEEEFLDVFSITNSLPGLIAVNSSLQIGRRLKGIMGALVSVMGVLTPSILIILLISEGIALIQGHPLVEAAFGGIRAGATAILLVVLIKMGKKSFTHIRELILALITVILIEVFHLNAVIVIIIAALTGFLIFPSSSKSK